MTLRGSLKQTVSETLSTVSVSMNFIIKPYCVFFKTNCSPDCFESTVRLGVTPAEGFRLYGLRRIPRRMTTPPHKLKSHLIPGECVQLRTSGGNALGLLEYCEAMRRAVRGEIEGVCSNSGKLRYVRELSLAAREVMPESEDVFKRSKAQPLNAVTNLGAYRQHLEHGVVWALCGCRALDGAKA
jgi:hypothetical protein